MAKIVHLALKVQDLEKASAFYQKVFGFVPVNARYDWESPEALASGVLRVVAPPAQRLQPDETVTLTVAPAACIPLTEGGE